MLSQRKGYRQRVSESPRLQLDELFWRTTSLMSISGVACLDDSQSDLHEVVVEKKRWADGLHMATGHYPETEVQEYLDGLVQNF